MSVPLLSVPLLPAPQPARPPRKAGMPMFSSSALERVRMAAVDAIARATGTPADFVKALFAEETARLDAQARLKQFVPLIAMKRVKQRLRELHQRRR